MERFLSKKQVIICHRGHRDYRGLNTFPNEENKRKNELNLIPAMRYCLSPELLAKVRNLPFDRLRMNGLRLKLFSFSVRGELVEPQKNTFARGSPITVFIISFSVNSVPSVAKKFLAVFGRIVYIPR
jgi:hypothetical protein